MERRVFNIGDRFDRLTVIGECRMDTPSRKNRRMITCLCDCGNITNVFSYNMPKTHSCGCKRKDSSRISAEKMCAIKWGKTYFGKSRFFIGKMVPDKFIEHHLLQFMNYCEAIIHPDGQIEYAIPSHIETLKQIAAKNNISINNKYSGLYELCEATGCVAVWYNFCCIPSSITAAQTYSIIALKKSGCISNESTITNSLQFA